MNEIKPIRTEADYAAAIEEIERAELDAANGTLDLDRLEVLVTLTHAYQKKHHPIDPPEPIAAILFAIDQGRITKKQLEAALGGRNRMSEVLARRRGLSLTMIRKLVKLGIPVTSLIGEIRLVKPKSAVKAVRSTSRARLYYVKDAARSTAMYRKKGTGLSTRGRPKEKGVSKSRHD